mgnify:CR=1 FL=1
MLALIIALPLTAFVVAWFLQRDRFHCDYMKLIEEAKNEDAVLIRQKLLLMEEHRRNAGLRRAMMALVLGPVVSLVSLLGDFVTDKGLADAMVVGGILITAYGLAGFMIWWMVDRKKPTIIK